MKAPMQELPDPANCYEKEVITTDWESSWTIMPEASQACHKLVHYGYKKGYS